MTSSARLQQEANAARAGLSSALEELKSSVTTTAITNGAMTFAKEGSNAVARAAIDRAMASPVAAMLIGAGIMMLMIGDKKVGSTLGGLVDHGKSAVKHAADAVTGPYDIIMTIETPDPRDIGRLVMNEIHGVTGIKRTVTCLAI